MKANRYEINRTAKEREREREKDAERLGNLAYNDRLGSKGTGVIESSNSYGFYFSSDFSRFLFVRTDAKHVSQFVYSTEPKALLPLGNRRNTYICVSYRDAYVARLGLKFVESMANRFSRAVSERRATRLSGVSDRISLVKYVCQFRRGVKARLKYQVKFEKNRSAIDVLLSREIPRLFECASRFVL